MNRVKICFRSLLLSFALCLPLLSGCGTNTTGNAISKSGFYFNTVIQVTLYDSSKESALEGCFDLAAEYEGYFSNTVADSDISQINENAGTPVTVHDETIELLNRAIYYGDLSGGKFDVTLGNLSDLWDFSTKALIDEADASMIPSDDEIHALLPAIDYHSIQISGNEVTLTDPDAKIDLGGIAKGYIADKMKAYLNDQGVTSGYINLGGNVLALGAKPDASTYKIGIQKPFAESGESIAAVEITDQTVVSSGVYERCFTVDGTLYHHLLDVTTGYPYNNGLLGITIITDESVDGDGLSTTCFALGLEDGMALVESLPDTEAIFITDDYKLHVSSGMGSTVPYEVLD